MKQKEFNIILPFLMPLKNNCLDKTSFQSIVSHLVLNYYDNMVFSEEGEEATPDEFIGDFFNVSIEAEKTSILNENIFSMLIFDVKSGLVSGTPKRNDLSVIIDKLSKHITDKLYNIYLSYVLDPTTGELVLDEEAEKKVNVLLDEIEHGTLSIIVGKKEKQREYFIEWVVGLNSLDYTLERLGNEVILEAEPYSNSIN